MPPAALRELERELRLTVAALGGRSEGRERMGSDAAATTVGEEGGEGVVGRNRRVKSVDLDMDAVVGALGEVRVGDER